MSTRITTARLSPARLRPWSTASSGVIDYLRVSVTDRCNYRCTYCMPEDGVDHVDRADILSLRGDLPRWSRCFVAWACAGCA